MPVGIRQTDTKVICVPLCFVRMSLNSKREKHYVGGVSPGVAWRDANIRQKSWIRTPCIIPWDS